MSRLKLLPWAIGVALLAVPFLVGANKLFHTDPTSPTGGGGGGGGNTKQPAAAGDALLVPGTVACESEPVAYGPCPVPQAVFLERVFVKEGQEVKAGDQLYKFDDRFAQADVKQADYALEAARKKHAQALAEQEKHPLTIGRAKNDVSAAEQKVDFAKRGVEAAHAGFDEQVKPSLVTDLGKPLPAEQIEKKKRNYPAIIQAEAQLAMAEADLADKKLQYQIAENGKGQLAAIAGEAEAAVKVREESLGKAKLAVAECVVRAKVAGVVEQIDATPGRAIGPQTRTPVLWLIPSGPRVVRAEVVPEFAYRVSGKLGQKATITDDTNTNLTYEGEVKRVASSFLPKRLPAADALAIKPSLVLEVEIEVKDPAPAGKPPLRVGQPVRVSIGQ